ncbi:MAG: response regulator [Elusimicrobia bacterium]|nr:response regulator [Elusimicrobiota bacterium]
MKVMIVEDNFLMRLTIKEFLIELGHEVISETVNAEAALKAFVELEPEAVFLDLILPGKSGLEILDDIRKINKDAKIIIVTAIEQEEIDKKLSNKGVDAVICKPFSYEDFKKIVKSVIPCNS